MGALAQLLRNTRVAAIAADMAGGGSSKGAAAPPLHTPAPHAAAPRSQLQRRRRQGRKGAKRTSSPPPAQAHVSKQGGQRGRLPPSPIRTRGRPREGGSTAAHRGGRIGRKVGGRSDSAQRRRRQRSTRPAGRPPVHHSSDPPSTPIKPATQTLTLALPRGGGLGPSASRRGGAPAALPRVNTWQGRRGVSVSTHPPSTPLLSLSRVWSGDGRLPPAQPQPGVSAQLARLSKHAKLRARRGRAARAGGRWAPLAQNAQPAT